MFVTVAGAPGVGLNVEVRNPMRVGTTPAAPDDRRCRFGLIGLAERVTLAQGRFEHGRTPDGDFVVRAWLPWAGVTEAGDTRSRVVIVDDDALVRAGLAMILRRLSGDRDRR